VQKDQCVEKIVQVRARRHRSRASDSGFVRLCARNIGFAKYKALAIEIAQIGGRSCTI
jgi:hypothetical protein